MIRSDNALEFESAPCTQFFADLGIIHQTSCVNRPQQNGRVERKHRNVLEMARVLRFQASFPLQYWGDYVLSATHIINRLPASVCRYKTPYELLFNKAPNYSHLKVLGCLAFVSNPCRHADKFQPQGIPYVFLGYPNHKKGYRLLNMFTKQEFVSRDMKFCEHIFPFQQASFDAYIKPIPALVSQSHYWPLNYLQYLSTHNYSLLTTDSDFISSSPSPMTSQTEPSSHSTSPLPTKHFPPTTSLH